MKKTLVLDSPDQNKKSSTSCGRTNLSIFQPPRSASIPIPPRRSGEESLTFGLNSPPKGSRTSVVPEKRKTMERASKSEIAWNWEELKQKRLSQNQLALFNSSPTPPVEDDSGNKLYGVDIPLTQETRQLMREKELIKRYQRLKDKKIITPRIEKL
ncbi:hypothetical protein AYM02_04955 [Coxiella burnetii]|nr:hypothetical protein AUR58_05545 [Coxiella burnetii]AML54670.1 hypothetical protein AYM38_04890 [Coxiella burnetii]ATN68636.1 hypothetical protein AYM00_05185 [Coxiella burnetii]ATN70560.1 hypothetical protein AYM02_04955 [Coxiella burnetii]ATN72486.1 hypothetical protein AYM11_04785 [Coxiella burnetii]